ncbi:hypothetical protein [Echinicola pacifica]|nr:hypothetical protein [Echinicola pacifica]
MKNVSYLLPKIILMAMVLFTIAHVSLSQTKIGSLYLKEAATQGLDSVYSANSSAIKADIPFRIDSINVFVEDGVIKRMFITTDQPDKYRFENQKIISIQHLNAGRLNDYFYNIREPKGKRTGIQLRQFLYYDNVSKYSMIPDDANFVLKASEPSYTFTRGSKLDIDLRVYTDLLGTIFGEPNGIIQTEGNFKILLNTNNLPNNNFVVFNYLKPSFQLSKFDSKDKFVTNEADVNRLEFIQKSPFTFGLDINIFNSQFRNGGNWTFDMGYVYYNSLLNNEENEDDPYQINSHGFKIQTGLDLRITEAAVFRINPSFQRHFMNKTEAVVDILDPQADGPVSILNINMELQQGLNGELSDKLFLRFIPYFNLSQTGGDFVQLQVGYAKSINNIKESLSPKK